MRPCASAELLTLICPERESLIDRRGESGGIARRHEPAGDLRHDRLARAAVIGGDDRTPHRLRLDDDAAETLGIARGGDDDIGQYVSGRHIPAFLDNAKAAGDPSVADCDLEFAAKPGALFGAGENTTDVASA